MTEITIVPATAPRFDDVAQALTGGGDGGSCWCLWWMMPAKDWDTLTRDDRRERLRAQTEGEPPPGLVAYVDGEPAGWVKVAPRTAQPRLARTRNLQSSPIPFDDESVWAITCFVVRREHRRSGLNAELLRAAVDHARARGARVVEGYPLDPSVQKFSSNELYHGILSTFLAAGFTEVARPKPARPIVALRLP